jgi:hypothetical protein
MRARLALAREHGMQRECATVHIFLVIVRIIKQQIGGLVVRAVHLTVPKI